jgi:hypothetical protein
MSWDETMRRIAAGEDVQAVLDEKSERESTEFAEWMRTKQGRPDLADKYLARVREIETGVYGARACWHALSLAQRRILIEANQHGGRLDRVGKEYRHKARNQPYKPVYVATVRNLCERDLMAWDGGAFDPEAAAIVTERGRFVLKHGAVQ